MTLPAVEAVDGAFTDNGNPLTKSFTITSANLLLVGITIGDSGHDPTAHAPAYGGTPLTLVTGSAVNDGNWTGAAWYYMESPPAGTANVTLSGYRDAAVHIISFTDYESLGTPSTNTANSTDPTVTVADSGTTGITVAAMSDDGSSGNTVQAHTLLYEAEDVESDTDHSSQYVVPTDINTAMSWTQSESNKWSASGLTVYGPQFGYHAIGATGFDNPSGNIVWCKAVAGGPAPGTPAANGTLNGIWVYAQSVSSTNGTLSAAVYSDNSGVPDARLAVNSSPVTAPNAGSPAWMFIDMSAANLSIVSGTQYWIALLVPSIGSGFDVSVAYDTADDLYYAGGSSFPATAGSYTHVPNERWSVYAEYTPSGGGGQTITAGLNTETDTAFSMTWSKSKAVNLTTEADSVLALTRVKRPVMGLNTETDSALALGTALKVKTLGLSSESDSALGLQVGTEVAVGQADETDSVFSLAATKTKALGLPVETDSPLAVIWKKVKSVAQIVETDSVLPLTIDRSFDVGLPSTSDTSLGVSRLKTVQVGLAHENDTAFGIQGFVVVRMIWKWLRLGIGLGV